MRLVSAGDIRGGGAPLTRPGDDVFTDCMRGAKMMGPPPGVGARICWSWSEAAAAWAGVIRRGISERQTANVTIPTLNVITIACKHISHSLRANLQSASSFCF